MQYSIYKFRFTTPVHFGSGRLSGSSDTLLADTVFSALCHEALSHEGEKGIKKLYDAAENDKLLISDLLPYAKKAGKTTGYYIPKPIMKVETEAEGDSGVKKLFKKLRFIPFDRLTEFVEGHYVPGEETVFGGYNVRGNAKINVEDDAEPFSVGNFTFFDSEELSCGLYLVVGTEEQSLSEWIEMLLDSLSSSGIGGERSAGYGKFELIKASDVPNGFFDHLSVEYKKYISLSLCMSEGEELDHIIKGAGYELVKRSGFVSSGRATDEILKKQDVFCFKGGSSFLRRFTGKVFDVSAGTDHPVYRYAKAMLFGVD